MFYIVYYKFKKNDIKFKCFLIENGIIFWYIKICIKFFLFVEFSCSGYIVGVFIFVGYCKVIYLFGMF